MLVGLARKGAVEGLIKIVPDSTVLATLLSTSSRELLYSTIQLANSSLYRAM
jgi:hypothetical protein